MGELEDLERRLKELGCEREVIEGRIRLLRAEESIAVPTVFIASDPRSSLGTPASDSIPETPAQKIELFLKLFRCRESVFPKLWNSKTGKKGYSPACNNEWIDGVCGKPPKGKVKCTECPNQAFPALDAVAVDRHLRGQTTIGTYAIRENDSCIFLACDFDGKGWQSDVFIYQSVAREMAIEVLIERSRSGNGAHAWIFSAKRHRDHYKSWSSDFNSTSGPTVQTCEETQKMRKFPEPEILHPPTNENGNISGT